jgi:hypothetical protein
MKHSAAKPLAMTDLREPESAPARVGRIVKLSADGHALVDFPGNDFGAIEARSAVSLTCSSGNQAEMNLPVLLVFENGDLTLPVIVGFVRDTVLSSPREQTIILPRSGRPDIVVDGKTIVFEASAEIVLRCGRSSVALRSDGKIVIKGTHIVSRSSGTHKIKGATVQLN